MATIDKNNKMEVMVDDQMTAVSHAIHELRFAIYWSLGETTVSDKWEFSTIRNDIKDKAIKAIAEMNKVIEIFDNYNKLKKKSKKSV